jgi:hypothetical protein
MNSSAHYLKLVWSAPSAPRSAAVVRTGHSSFDRLYAALEDLRRLDPGEARRMMRRVRHDLKREVGGRRIGRAQQLELFGQTHATAFAEVPPGDKVVHWRTPFLMEQHSGPCPRCGRALVQRSRVGASIYYTCATHGCPNTEALFLLILGTGDD